MKSLQLSMMCVFLFASLGLNAQSLNPQAVNSAGISMTQSNGSLNFTVGDLIIETHTDADGNSLGGGFTNSTTDSSVTSIDELVIENMDVTLFPNPTSDWLNVQFAEPLDDAVSIEIINTQGKILHSQNYPGGQTQLQLQTSHLATGNYFVHIRSHASESSATFKLVKANNH